VNTDGAAFSVLKEFVYSDGANPAAGLTLSGGVLYGTTYYGGSSNSGTVFKLNTDGSGFTVIKEFSATGSNRYTNSDGAFPYAPLVLSGSTIYGTTYMGGTLGAGTVFKLNTEGSGYTVLKDFNSSGDGDGPVGGLLLSGNTLYGVTIDGGAFGNGLVFKVNTNGSGYAVLKSFDIYNDGRNPNGGLTLAGTTLYGSTVSGGPWDSGTIFKLHTDGSGFKVITARGGALGRLTPSGSVLYGTSGYVFKLDLSIPLIAQTLGGAIILSWSDPDFILQSAPDITDIYTNIPGATSPYTNAIAGPQRFFRLIENQ